jgi:hypothetical protein
MGAITAWGFQLAYAVFQVPAGLVGERVGARTALMLSLLGYSLASVATGLMPESSAATPTLWITRVLLGISQAALFPVAAMAVMVHVPANRLRRRDDPARAVDGEPRIVYRALGRGGVVLLRGQEIDVAAEGELPLLAQPGRPAGEAVDRLGSDARKPFGVLPEQSADIVPVRRLHACLSQHPLQRQLDDLLRLADDVRVCRRIEQHAQDRQPYACLGQIALGE